MSGRFDHNTCWCAFLVQSCCMRESQKLVTSSSIVRIRVEPNCLVSVFFPDPSLSGSPTPVLKLKAGNESRNAHLLFMYLWMGVVKYKDTKCHICMQLMNNTTNTVHDYYNNDRAYLMNSLCVTFVICIRSGMYSVRREWHSSGARSSSKLNLTIGLGREELGVYAGGAKGEWRERERYNNKHNNWR